METEITGRKKSRARLWGLVLAAAVALGIWRNYSASEIQAGGFAMPEFSETSADMWINSAPLRKADLRGKVVLLEVWTSI